MDLSLLGQELIRLGTTMRLHPEMNPFGEVDGMAKTKLILLTAALGRSHSIIRKAEAEPMRPPDQLTRISVEIVTTL